MTIDQRCRSERQSNRDRHGPPFHFLPCSNELQKTSERIDHEDRIRQFVTTFVLIAARTVGLKMASSEVERLSYRYSVPPDKIRQLFQQVKRDSKPSNGRRLFTKHALVLTIFCNGCVCLVPKYGHGRKSFGVGSLQSRRSLPCAGAYSRPGTFKS